MLFVLGSSVVSVGQHESVLNVDKDKAAALRQAKIKLIQNHPYAHPYYWAPFVLVGAP